MRSRSLVFSALVYFSPSVFADFASNKSQASELSTFQALDETSPSDIRKKLTSYAMSESSYDNEYLYWLYNASRYHGLDQDLDSSRDFTKLVNFVKETGHKTKVARNKLIDIPDDIEGLYALTMKNFESLRSTVAHNYSLIKYGDGDALNVFAEKLAQRIRSKYGEKIYDGTWILANTSFYHVLNTAATLTRKVGAILNLPTPQLDMHIRPMKTHHGEFGTINTFEQRYQIMQDAFQCTNEHEIKGKNVIYIDDLYASGMHVMEHMNIFKKYGAKSLHSISVIDILDPTLKLEGMINFTTVKVESPRIAAREIAKIYNKPHSVIVTRSVKYLLQMPEDVLNDFLHAIPAERVFEMVEAGDNEGYKGSKLMGKGLEYVRAFAEKLAHSKDMKMAATTKILFSDYDNTVMPTHEPIDDDRAKLLSDFMEKGNYVVISSQEGFTDSPNLHDKVIAPLRYYLSKEKRDPSILENLTVIGGNGVERIGFDKSGNLDPSKYRNWGMSKDERSLVYRIIDENFKDSYERIKDQNSTIKLFLKKNVRVGKVVRDLKMMLSKALPFIEVSGSNRLANMVYLKNTSGTKMVARDFVLNELRQEIFEKTGVRVSRDEIVVTGDSMGVEAEQNNDAGMFIFGATNFALGLEAIVGTETKHLGKFTEGFREIVTSIVK